MKKVIFIFLLATSLSAQVQLGKGVQIGYGSGEGSGTVNGGTTGQVAQYPANGTAVQGATVTGDATLANGGALTLSTVNSSPGNCGDATHVSQVSVNGKGLTTNCTPVPITFPGGGATLQTNASNNSSQSILNLVSGPGIDVANTSGGNVTFTATTPALFPSTPGVVVNTSTTASRNGSYSDIVPLWAGGSCSGYLKSDGTCGGGGSASAGAVGTVQTADGSGGFAASSPAYVATSLLSPALNNFRSALYTSDTYGGGTSGSTNVLIIGTSITCCIGPTVAADSPMAQLRSTLQQFGANGTGFIPVGSNGTTATRPEWTLAGTWTTVADLGPTQTNSSATFNSMFVASGNGVGNTLTMSAQSGDTLTLAAETTTDSGGCAVSVDGGSPGIFANTTSGSPVMTLTSYVPGPGSHTIVVQPSGSGKCYFYAARWTSAYTAGVIVNNIAHGYATTNAYCATPSAQMALVPLISPTPSLAIIELGVNEIIEGTMSQATYASQMQACTTYLRSINPNMSILYLDDYNINPASVGSGITYAQVRATEQALALANNAAYMSIGDSWGTYAQANALGLMAGDGLHPSNLGGVNYGALVASYITLGINNLPLNTIKPFIVQQPYPSDVTGYSSLNNNPQTPSKTKLTTGVLLYNSGVSGGSYVLGLDLGINPVNQDYGPRLFNNEGSAASSSDVLFQHYVNTAGYPQCQGTACGWIQDGYVESSDSSFHMVGPLYGASFVGTGTATFTLGSSSIVGTGATTPACSSTSCTSGAGTVSFTTGTGTGAGGTALTVTLPFTRAGVFPCIATTNTIGSSAPAIECSGSGATLLIETGTLPASTPLIFTYAAFGK